MTPTKADWLRSEIEKYRWNGRYSYDEETPIMELLELEKGV